MRCRSYLVEVQALKTESHAEMCGQAGAESREQVLPGLVCPADSRLRGACGAQVLPCCAAGAGQVGAGRRQDLRRDGGGHRGDGGCCVSMRGVDCRHECSGLACCGLSPTDQALSHAA
jgi:hypothetical protein